MVVPRTRRFEEIIKDIRRLSYQEQYSYTEGWDDNTLVEIGALALDKIYSAITQIDQPGNIAESKIDVVAGQFAYDIPIEVNVALRIMDVRFKWGTQAYEFNTLTQGDIQDRYDFPTNYPIQYCLRNSQLLLSPTPNVTLTEGLIINYQQRMRKLDIRRGKVSSYTTGPVTFTLNFTFTSQKDTNLKANAESVLDFVDYCCLVDRYGTVLVSAIPLNGYNASTQVLTPDPTFTLTAAQQTTLNAYIAAGNVIYVVQGDYSSTHSMLDRQCEDALVEISVARLLSLQSDSAGQAEYMNREAQVIDRLINQYRRYRPSIFPVRWVGNRGLNVGSIGNGGNY